MKSAINQISAFTITAIILQSYTNSFLKKISRK